MTNPEALAPCRVCGAPCYVDTIEPNQHMPQPATIWVCSKSPWRGGDCPDKMAYLSEGAWNQRASTDVAKIVERLRADADLTEQEATSITAKSVAPHLVAERWASLVATKRGISDWIERGDWK